MSVSPRDAHMHETWMTRAIQLAELGLNTATPNPRVGCVIVNDDAVVLGEGFHLKAGEDHAEVAAIKAVKRGGLNAIGATAYVTLEPCNHQGRTGPCTEALISAGVSCVVYGMEDPNPKVAGTGLNRLREAGVLIEGPVLSDQCARLNPGFIKRMRTGLPWVRCKLAMSLDGRTAMANGESQWITGPEARADVQDWRARSCAIVTGVGTIQADNPSMTVRDPRLGENLRQPLRVIVDTRLRCNFEEKIFSEPGQTVVATTALTQPGRHPVPVWTLPGDDNARVDLPALLKKLSDLEINEVWVEAGAQLAGSFVRQNLVDELIVYIAPKILGSHAKPLLDWPLARMNDAMNLNIQSMTSIGRDWRVRARPLAARDLFEQILVKS